MILGLVLLFGGVLLVRGAVKDDHPLNPLVETFGGQPLPVPGRESEAVPGSVPSEGALLPSASSLGRPDGDHLWLTAREVHALARSVGFSNPEAIVMTTIAYRESRFDAHAVNASSGAVGIWQLFPGSPAFLDPYANAQAAREKFLASLRAGYSGYRPWAATSPVPV